MLRTVWDILDEDFTNLVKESINYSDLMRKCGYNNVGNRATVTKRIEKLNLSTDHFGKTFTPRTNNRTLPVVSITDIFIENSKYNSNQCIKKKLFEHFKWEYKCRECNIDSWQGQRISLELDHINGNNKDNRIENLRLLCPNCHSLTPTFRAKNKKPADKLKCIDCDNEINKQNLSGYCFKCAPKNRNIVPIALNKPTLNQLETDLKKLKTYEAVANKYNVPNNTIRKWIKHYNQNSKKEKPIEQYILDILNLEI